MHIEKIKEKWIDFLISERRVSSHTVDGYKRDVDFFLTYLNKKENVDIIDSKYLSSIKISVFRSFVTSLVRENKSNISFCHPLFFNKNIKTIKQIKNINTCNRLGKFFWKFRRF